MATVITQYEDDGVAEQTVSLQSCEEAFKLEVEVAERRNVTVSVLLESPHLRMPQWNGERMVRAGSQRCKEKWFSAGLQRLDPRSHEAEQSAISETHAKPLGTLREVALAIKPVETIPCHEWPYSGYVAIQTDDHLRSKPALPKKRGDTQIVLLVPGLESRCSLTRVVRTERSEQGPGRGHPIAEEVFEVEALVLQAVEKGGETNGLARWRTRSE